MDCQECGHLFMKHDDYGCKQAACECMKNQPELMGEYTLPELPAGLRFLKSGYTKEYAAEPDKLYDTVLQVINQMGTFTVRKQDREQRWIKTRTKPFGRLLSGSRGNSHALSHLDDAFDMDISVNSGDTGSSVLTFQVPLVRYRRSDSPPEYRRTFFHLHAMEFVRRIDESL